MPRFLYHLTRRRLWADAERERSYPWSTDGVTFDEQGFVHCCTAGQLAGVAERFFAGVDEPLAVLQIDTSKLPAEAVFEEAPGTHERFPHLYDPLPVDAVVAVHLAETPGYPGGRFTVPPTIEVPATPSGHLLDAAAAPTTGETEVELARMGATLVQQIVSGQVDTPAWYLQDVDEWVVVLEGSATLEVAGRTFALTGGDWVLLPAGEPHVLAEVAPGTRWLCVFADRRAGDAPTG